MNTAPAIYECQIDHARTAPVSHSFSYGSYLWLVDLDTPPRLPRLLRPLARFEARDHIGDPARSIRSNVEQYLAGQDIDLTGGQILMLTNARVLGYVFNPLTVYWCRYADGSPACVVAEVHNTYGGRHRYLLRPNARDRATTAKEFYVSPFFPVDGDYRMYLPEPTERLAISISLHREGGRPFVATLRGQRRPATVRTVLRSALRHPWVTAVVALRIRRHGVHLFLRGLPVQPRPEPAPVEGVR